MSNGVSVGTARSCIGYLGKRDGETVVLKIHRRVLIFDPSPETTRGKRAHTRESTLRIVHLSVCGVVRRACAQRRLKQRIEMVL